MGDHLDSRGNTADGGERRDLDRASAGGERPARGRDDRGGERPAPGSGADLQPSASDEGPPAPEPGELIDTEEAPGRPSDDDPFFLEGDGDEACLLIHGASGTAGDVRGMGEHLHEQGLTVQGITLPGHARRPPELSGLTWEACYDCVRQAWRRLDRSFRRVHVVGFSLGGALSLHLAAQEPVENLAVLAPGLYVNIKVREVIGGSLGLVPGTRLHARLRWNLNLLALFRVLGQELHRVRCPLLIVHARDDALVKPRSSLVVFDRVMSAERRLVLLSDGGHLLPWGPAHPRVWEELDRHIGGRRLARAPAPPRPA